MDFSISPAIRRLRYHDPEKVHVGTDLFVMHSSSAIEANFFHDWLRKTILTEQVLPPKGEKVFEFDVRSGWYDMFAPSVHAMSYLVAREEGPSEVHLELHDGQMLPDQIQVKIGRIRVHVRNEFDTQIPVAAMFLGDDDDEHPAPMFTIGRFLTGKRILTNQTFRKLFNTETLEVGTGLQIKNLTVLFTDLQASTAMYERVGDLKALEIVRHHFEVLEGVVASHQGAVVKTIGDAVMAVFYEPGQAISAATQMIDNVRRAAGHGEDLVLKIGLHSGPCVAIQSNNQMDYFGRTVNIAARVQALANGGEIVCSEELWQAPGVLDALSGRGLTAKKETASLKGIGDRFAVRRVSVLANAARFAAPRSTRPTRPAPHPARAKSRAKVGAKGRVKAARAKARPAPLKGRRARAS